MKVNSFYPVLCSTDVEKTARWYIEHFGFGAQWWTDWYVSLRHGTAEQFELAVVDAHHPTVPAAYRRPARGVLLNVEVDDVDAEWERLVVGAGLKVVLGLRSEDFGQRHFIVAGPDDVLVDVIQIIPPSPQYADAIVGAAAAPL